MASQHPLKRFRQAKGLTQGALAKELGVRGNTVWRWENGSRLPRRTEMLRIVERTGISPSELLGYAEAAE